jgi:hypothetical protein
VASLQDPAGLELVTSDPLPKIGGANAAGAFHIGFILAQSRGASVVRTPVRRPDRTVACTAGGPRWLDVLLQALRCILIEAGWCPTADPASGHGMKWRTTPASPVCPHHREACQWLDSHRQQNVNCPV